MVISKTPLRISFFGGGTDYPEHFRKHGGLVIATTIDKYSFITVKRLNGLFEYNYRVSYSKGELCKRIDEIQHPSVRECLKFLNLRDGLEIHYVGDLPARTGLGSSSSFTVGLLNALYALNGRFASKDQLAREAVHVEQKLIRERVGVQDQYAAAFGGLNKFEIKTDGTVVVHPVIIPETRKKIFHDHLMLFYTGISRHAHEILKEQVEKTKRGDNDRTLLEMANLVEPAVKILQSDREISEFGELLHHAWVLKQTLSSAISNERLNEMYDAARKAGALGGKLLGAGGGGFFLFFVPPARKNRVREALRGYAEVEFAFENEGTRVIFAS
jgi:D-glycero-alpha-D-manno-heptose-7-phosphate kinase